MTIGPSRPPPSIATARGLRTYAGSPRSWRHRLSLTSPCTASGAVAPEVASKPVGCRRFVPLGCGDAKAAAVAILRRLDGKTLACDASKAERAATIQSEKTAWEKELTEWTHERDAFSMDMIEEQKREPGNA